jgi:hypothetical protein
MRESTYQRQLIDKLLKMFPDCLILKNDSSHVQGIPDLSIFYMDKWAMLEVKVDEKAPTRPNQEYYIEKLSEMSFAAIIYPENEEAVLDALQSAFGVRGPARIS